LNFYYDAVKIDPANYKARHSLGVALGALGFVDQAEEELQKALAQIDTIAAKVQRKELDTFEGFMESEKYKNRVVEIGYKLKESFFQYFRYYPSPNEVQSWRNSLRAVSQVFDYSGLNDHGVILEYQLPQTSKRLDCMITGRDKSGGSQAVIIELKQWERCEMSDGENEVTTWVGGAKREVLHPSVQVGQYKMYLQDLHPAFDGKNSIKLDAVSYLHNYSPVKCC